MRAVVRYISIGEKENGTYCEVCNKEAFLSERF